MTYRIMNALAIGGLLLAAVNVPGQQPSETDQLKAAIQKLEVVERDPATPSEVRELNHRFLIQRRTQLLALLKEKIKGLQTYQANVGSTLTAEENGAIENSIAAQRKVLREIEADTRSDSSSGTPSATETAGNSTTSEIESAQTRSAANGPQPAADSAPVAATSAQPATIKAPNSASASQTTSTPQVTPQPDCALYTTHPKTFSLVDQYVCNLVKSVKDAKLRDPNNNMAPNPLAGLDLDAAFSRLVIVLVAKKGRSDEMVRAEEGRVDKQVGGGSANSGSTSLVVKGNVPAILGFAVENGALSKETSGTTITFRGNPVGIAKALAGQGLISGFDNDATMTRFLRRFSFAFSFDTDRGQGPGVFTGTKQQLSEVSARAVLYDKRDPRRQEYKKDWEDFLAGPASQFLAADAQARDVFLDTSTPITKWKDPAMAGWFIETQQALAKASIGQVESVLTEQLNKMPIDKLSPDFNSELAKFEQKFNLFLRDRNTILKKVGQAGVLTFDYVDERNVNKPDLSHFRFIGEKGFSNGRVDLTGNVSFSIFNTRPNVNVSRWRDAQAALQLDGTFGSAEKTGVFVLSFAYKYQHLAENAMTEAGTIVPNTKGNISVGQAKLTVPIKGLGIKLPISVTFANRTELIKEKAVRGNFGLTFDLDTIFAKWKPF
jgi:hypothetical protein